MRISTRELKKIIMEEYSIMKEKDGLYSNIHKKRERGEAPAKPGDKDYPDEKSWEKAAKSKKKKTNEQDEFAGLPFDDGQEEHEQVEIERKNLLMSVEELLIHIPPEQVVSHLQDLASQVEQGKISESINENQPDARLETLSRSIEDLKQVSFEDVGEKADALDNMKEGVISKLKIMKFHLKGGVGGSAPLEEGQPVMYPEEVQAIAQIVEPVAQSGGDLTAIADAVEQAGFKVTRGYRYIMTKVKYAKIMIAPTSEVELEGNETVVGNFAIGEM